ncbi:hypothetical protein RSOLAG1IB_02449 [Rhizoctonia solani AG-1 IB]|uniref:Uncharacterized protein n=1 Tax=Thanatephorus cucumeris (strain AG1-IB / isolate 7/3/14) TaxID=1108050 RepID=A0A0B7FJ70_THACB|nr:hypothetical protein RSOLAG1IB_02449 [Rhizoctonia solani AG-1 IB]
MNISEKFASAVPAAVFAPFHLVLDVRLMPATGYSNGAHACVVSEIVLAVLGFPTSASKGHPKIVIIASPQRSL